MEEIIQENEVLVTHDSDWLEQSAADQLLAELEALVAAFTPDRYKIMGREVLSPRLVCAFGDSGITYHYAGMARDTLGWPSVMQSCKERLEMEFDQPYNYALVNLYRDGNDYIGWHADKEADLVDGSTIASLSLGAKRDFLFRRIHTQKGAINTHKIELTHGSLVLMQNNTQKHYKHSLPKRKKIKSERWNITFRWMKRA